MFSIGELARETGVKVPTIRYYERIGLIDPARRTAGNQRRYSSAGMERLVFIKHARELGIPIDAIRELIELSAHPERPCNEADEIAAQHLAAVRLRINRLQQLESELARIASGCKAEQVGECYVLRALSDHSLCEAEH